MFHGMHSISFLSKMYSMGIFLHIFRHQTIHFHNMFHINLLLYHNKFCKCWRSHYKFVKFYLYMNQGGIMQHKSRWKNINFLYKLNINPHFSLSKFHMNDGMLHNYCHPDIIFFYIAIYILHLIEVIGYHRRQYSRQRNFRHILCIFHHRFHICLTEHQKICGSLCMD